MGQIYVIQSDNKIYVVIKRFCCDTGYVPYLRVCRRSNFLVPVSISSETSYKTSNSGYEIYNSQYKTATP